MPPSKQSPKHKLTRATRGWVKRINGKLKWICGDKVAPDGISADDFYEQNMTDLWQPPQPVQMLGAVNVKYLADAFYDRKQRADRDPRTLANYRESLANFVELVGGATAADELEPSDFAKVRLAWAKRFGPDRLCKFIINVRSMFKWGRKPPYRLREPDYGDEFDLPSKKEFRSDRKKSRDKHGKKFFTPADIAKLLSPPAATPNLKAMILLALNAGFGNTDAAELPLSVLDLGRTPMEARSVSEGTSKNQPTGFLDYARGKTGIDRRVPLWPETIAALKAAIALRNARLERRRQEELPIAPEALPLVFVTRQGRPYMLDKESKKTPGKLLHKDRVAMAFNKLCAGLDLAQFGRGYYSLRRTHRTLADEVGDKRAADLIMGHATDSDMGGVYVQVIEDVRLQKIVDHVKSRLGISSTHATKKTNVKK